jgi:hypothetical protein
MNYSPASHKIIYLKFSVLLLMLMVFLPSFFFACIVITESPVPEAKSIPSPQPSTMKPPVIVIFEVSPVKVTSVESTTLRWEVTGADKVIIEPGIGEVPPAGIRNIKPSHNIVYKLTATNDGGSVVRNAEVIVYENVYASKIALTEEDVKSKGFVYYQNSEPTIKKTISTYYVIFKRSGFVASEEILDVTVSVHDSVTAAEDRYIEIKSNARTSISGVIAIGDEGYSMQLLGSGESELTTHVIRFRKNNVYVNIGTLPDSSELEYFARIIESRIK